MHADSVKSFKSALLKRDLIRALSPGVYIPGLVLLCTDTDRPNMTIAVGRVLGNAESAIFLHTLLGLYTYIFPGFQIYGGPGSLSHDFKIWPITLQGSGPSGPILFSCEKISL